MKNSPNWTRGSCIGKGSFGTVNLAVDKFNGHVFAVKSANTNAIPFSEALENEIRILKTLSSPYIVAYHGDDVTMEDNSMVFRNLHMEYMPGGTVADVGKEGHDDVTIRSYTKCIVSALSYIHARNIVHCDVKGRNVLVGEMPGSAKLADFGSAIDLSCENKGARGSPLWMAPEVVRGEYQGPESDVWSLGCTVIEMITGQPAWLDRGVDTFCQIGYSNDLPNLPAHCSDELRDFLNKCLVRDRSERWSCDELLQHPYLSSCTILSKFEDNKCSPRSVFDWSNLNFSNEESQVENSSTGSTSSNVKQRIGKLCFNVAANWESDGWEVVRKETVTISEPSASIPGLTVTEREMICTPSVLLSTSPIHTRQTTMCETIQTSKVNLTVYKLTEPWPGYHDSIDNNDEESRINESERTKWEYGDSNGNFVHDDHRCINNNAKSTSSGWASRDIDYYYSCYVCLSLDMLLLLLLFNLNGTRHIYYKILFVFVFKPTSDPVSVLYFLINFLPTFYFSEDMRSNIIL